MTAAAAEDVLAAQWSPEVVGALRDLGWDGPKTTAEWSNGDNGNGHGHAVFVEPPPVVLGWRSPEQIRSALASTFFGYLALLAYIDPGNQLLPSAQTILIGVCAFMAGLVEIAFLWYCTKVKVAAIQSSTVIQSTTRKKAA